MNKKLKVLSSTALAATLVVPVAAPAFAASTVSLSTSPISVSAGQKLTDSVKVIVDVKGGTYRTTDDSFTLRLPAYDSSADDVVATATYDGDYPVKVNGDGDADTSHAKITVEKVSAREFKVNLKNVDQKLRFSDSTESSAPLKDLQKDLRITLEVKGLTVPAGATGNVEAKIESESGSAFNSGSVVLATVGNGSYNTVIDDVLPVTTASSKVAQIRIKEDRAGAFEEVEDSIRLKLPTGFKWSKQGTLKVDQGDAQAAVASMEDRELKIKVTKASNRASQIVLDGFEIRADDSDAKTGDVTVEFKGSSSSAISSLVIAKYGNYTGSVSAGTPKDVFGGATKTKIGEFTIQEDSPATLMAGRTIKLTLGGNAKWEVTDENKPVGPKLKSSDSQLYGFAFDGDWEFSGSDHTVIQRTIKTASSTKAAKLVFEKGEIDVAPNANGDIKVTVGGTAGISGEAVVAKAKAPVTVEVADKKDVVIGTQQQQISDIVITETASENIDKGKLVLEFPEGVRPANLPDSVEVDGDLKIDKAGITRSDNTLTIPVTTTSSKASKISVKGLKLDIDRTVPEGDVKVKVKGDSLFTGYSYKDKAGNTVAYNPFSPSEYVAEGVVANVTTPGAGKGTAATAVFKLNSKTFTVNGKSVEMDVQPLVKWDRAYVPVRFAANALGVADENILWDDKTQTVTISKDGKIVQMTVGKKEYTVNGVKVPMDAPVLRNKAETNNRTMLPLRYIANALNVPVDWNKETSEITLGEVK